MSAFIYLVVKELLRRNEVDQERTEFTKKVYR